MKVLKGVISGQGPVAAIADRLIDASLQGVHIERVVVEVRVDLPCEVVVILDRHVDDALLGRYSLENERSAVLVISELSPAVVLDPSREWRELHGSTNTAPTRTSRTRHKS